MSRGYCSRQKTSFEYHIETPVRSEDVERLHVGDVLYVSGILVTARDLTHSHILSLVRKGAPLPIDLRGLALYHAGPIVRRISGEWKVLSVGPTTSMRMDIFEPEVIERTGVKIIIGKGGMGRRTREALAKHKGIYAIYPGGCGALAARHVRRVLGVYFLEELGPTEAMWVLEVERFGPLIVVMDSRGEDLYSQMRSHVMRRLREILLGKSLAQQP